MALRTRWRETLTLFSVQMLSSGSFPPTNACRKAAAEADGGVDRRAYYCHQTVPKPFCLGVAKKKAESVCSSLVDARSSDRILPLERAFRHFWTAITHLVRACHSPIRAALASPICSRR